MRCEIFVTRTEAEEAILKGDCDVGVTLWENPKSKVDETLIITLQDLFNAVIETLEVRYAFDEYEINAIEMIYLSVTTVPEKVLEGLKRAEK